MPGGPVRGWGQALSQPRDLRRGRLSLLNVLIWEPCPRAQTCCEDPTGRQCEVLGTWVTQPASSSFTPCSGEEVGRPTASQVTSRGDST